MGQKAVDAGGPDSLGDNRQISLSVTNSLLTLSSTGYQQNGYSNEARRTSAASSLYSSIA